MIYTCTRTGVAQLLDSLSHFSNFEMFCEPQLNTYLKGMQKKVLNFFTEIIFIENINNSTKYVY